jgi:hypothetical protein
MKHPLLQSLVFFRHRIPDISGRIPSASRRGSRFDVNPGEHGIIELFLKKLSTVACHLAVPYVRLMHHARAMIRESTVIMAYALRQI